jgi:hypothetical protein
MSVNTYVPITSGASSCDAIIRFSSTFLHVTAAAMPVCRRFEWLDESGSNDPGSGDPGLVPLPGERDFMRTA